MKKLSHESRVKRYASEWPPGGSESNSRSKRAARAANEKRTGYYCANILKGVFGSAGSCNQRLQEGQNAWPLFLSKLSSIVKLLFYVSALQYLSSAARFDSLP